MDKVEQQLSDEAIQWVKQHQKELVERLSGITKPAPVQAVSIFMAGSPGAGKTEFSRRLIEERFGTDSVYIIRIDPDEIRETLPCYVAGKAEIFQGAVSIAVEKIHDNALHEGKSFLLDGTLWQIDKARANIKRSVDRKRAVLIEYVYQDPFVAWDFTKKREAVEGRNIPKEAFVEQFFLAGQNAAILKREFGKDITLDIVRRNIRTEKYEHWFNVENIDSYIEDTYNREKLIAELP